MRAASAAVLAFACVVPVLGLGACPTDEDDADAGPDPDNDTDAGTIPDAGVLDLTRDPDCPADVAWVGEVLGDVVNESGDPVEGAVAQMCIRTNGGLFLCLQPERSEATGEFHIVVAPNARCAERATMRVLVPLENSGTVYCGVELSLTEPSLQLASPYVMVATALPVEAPDPGDDAVERTLTFADGLEVDVTPADMVFPVDHTRLAARALAPDDVPACLLDGAPAFDGVYAFSPESELNDVGFAMRIPNSTALANGTTVELWLLGGLSTSLADGTRVEEGVWRQFGTGSVTGGVIDVPAAEGLPSFNWIGFRPAP